MAKVTPLASVVPESEEALQSWRRIIVRWSKVMAEGTLASVVLESEAMRCRQQYQHHRIVIVEKCSTVAAADTTTILNHDHFHLESGEEKEEEALHWRLNLCRRALATATSTARELLLLRHTDHRPALTSLQWIGMVIAMEVTRRVTLAVAV